MLYALCFMLYALCSMEEQQAFRSDRRIGKHLLTACLVMEKTWAANVPILLVNLDLSKAFDRIRWSSLWQALLAH